MIKEKMLEGKLPVGHMLEGKLHIRINVIRFFKGWRESSMFKR
jgi:hypothetical protein